MHASAHETVTSFTPLETVVATNAINGRLSLPSTAHWSLLGSPSLVPIKPEDQAAVSPCCISSPLLPCTMLLASPRLAMLRCIFVAVKSLAGLTVVHRLQFLDHADAAKKTTTPMCTLSTSL
jgi:hypothetical protein